MVQVNINHVNVSSIYKYRFAPSFRIEEFHKFTEWESWVWKERECVKQEDKWDRLPSRRWRGKMASHWIGFYERGYTRRARNKSYIKIWQERVCIIKIKIKLLKWQRFWLFKWPCIHPSKRTAPLLPCDFLNSETSSWHDSTYKSKILWINILRQQLFCRLKYIFHKKVPRKSWTRNYIFLLQPKSLLSSLILGLLRPLI